MDNIVECISRKYRVETPGGTIIEVESDKPLSTQLNAKLLEEDTDINEFFKYHKIMGLRQVFRSPGSEKTPLPRIISKEGTMSPRARLNELLKMRGEFSRQDYIDFLFNNCKYKLNKWTSHNDIKDALHFHKIELVEERKGRESRKYKVIDTSEIEESLYMKLLQDRKLQMSTIT